MTDALERAAQAVHNSDFVSDHQTEEHYLSDPFYADIYSRYARAALLAFLDADEAMVERVAQIIATTMVSAYSNPAIWAEDVEMFRRRYARSDTPSPDNPIATARAAIAALREMLEEKK